MSSVALHFASGAAFFSGSACLVAGLLVVTFARGRLLPAIGRLCILIGLFVIVMSATPLPVWAWCVWGATFVMWIVARLTTVAGRLRVPFAANETLPEERVSNSQITRRQGCGTRSVLAALVVIACTLAAVGWELSWQLAPHGMAEISSHAGKRDVRTRLVVMGDSLSAADFTEGGDPWPTLLAHDQRIEVANLAFSGAKARSALKRLNSAEVAGAVVLLEIGGNDILGGTTAAEFERDLDALLTKIGEGTPSGTIVIMLELPLPPLFNRFGEIQRRLAQRHHVILIPKRFFASVLSGEAATLDGLHLSAAGQRRMANMVWEHVSPYLHTR
jgi:acyl-CoA thioesterase-1